jgi:2-methylcitrate dehydratase PrpD
MIRLGLALRGPTILYRGIWPTYIGTAFGVAAVAARLMRLDEKQAAHALALALTTAAPGVGHHNAPTTTRWLALGLAARNGDLAARAARAGFTSDLNLLDGKFFASVYDIRPDTAELTRGLDQHLAMLDVSFKPWCAARQTMAATQALKEILADGVTLDSIVRIGVAVLPPHLRMIDHGVTMGDRFSQLTSVQYQMAVAAIQPELAYGLTAPPGPTSPDLLFFMERIKVRAEESLIGAGYPQAWPAHVTVTTRAKRHERSVLQVPGDPARPFGEDGLQAKFVKVFAPASESESAEAVFALALRGIDDPPGTLGEIERLSQSP